MHSLRKSSVWILILLLTLLAACSSAPAIPTSTPTLPSGGGDTSGAGSAPAGDPGGSQDAATGLDEPVLGITPPEATPPPVPTPRPDIQGASNPPEGSASIAIGGDLALGPITGGTCSTLDGETYLSVPPSAGAPPPYASLVIYAGPSNIRSGTLVWATSEQATDSAVVSAQDTFEIIINPDGFSGSFEGTAHRVTSGVPVQEVISVSGVFNCVAGLLRVYGEHPVDMTGAQCETTPQLMISSGRSGENAALFMVEPGASPDHVARGGLSWRVDGTQYGTNWLNVTINPDRLSGSYYGEGRRPDGSTFPIQGAFNCLGM
ncbi:MAG: hypothetical protein KJZ53_01355 [Anaerolineales bacterium]|nr:hypothetical protein [Anaerolineales bacterium]